MATSSGAPSLPSANQSSKQSSTSKPWLFKPGQSGNPTGRPKGIPNLRSVLDHLLLETDPETGLTGAQLWRKAVRDGLVKQERWAVQLVAEYQIGLPVQEIHMLKQQVTWSSKDIKELMQAYIVAGQLLHAKGVGNTVGNTIIQEQECNNIIDLDR